MTTKQTTLPGMTPPSIAEKLQAAADKPLAGGRYQAPLDIGLFDDARRSQLDLVDLAKKCR